LRQAGIELSQSLDDAQPGPHRPLCVIFVRQGVAEVDEQTIAEVLRDMPLKAGDHLGAGLLIGAHYLAQLFWVELAGQHGRVHQVTEQHGELATFGLRELRFGWCDGRRAKAGSQRDRWLHRLRGCRCWWWDGTSLTTPDQAAAYRINHMRAREEDGILEGLKVLLVQLELEPEGLICHTPAALEHGNRLVEDLLKRHC
jgi:hypothetical protein